MDSAPQLLEPRLRAQVVERGGVIRVHLHCPFAFPDSLVVLPALAVDQDFDFGTLSHSSLHLTGSFATAILRSPAERDQGAIWGRKAGCAFGMESTGALTPFPYDFSDTSPSPLSVS